MKQQKIKFEMSYLAAIVDARIGRERLASIMSICEGRIDSMLCGKVALSMDEMLALARILQLDREQFERCFFSTKSSENLNSYKNKYEVRE